MVIFSYYIDKTNRLGYINQINSDRDKKGLSEILEFLNAGVMVMPNVKNYDRYEAVNPLFIN
jgi:hypothetical protein